MLLAALFSVLVAAPPSSPEAAIAAAFEGPRSRVRRIVLGDREAIIGVEVDRAVALADLPADFENRYEIAVGALAALRPEIDAVHLLVAHPGEPLAPPPAKKRSGDARAPLRAVRPDPATFPFGQALAGRVIAISAGHGYIYYDALGRYSTQRSNTKWNGCGSCRGIVEDFETHEIVVRHLVPLLEGAGARVILVRDRSYADVGAIVDDGASGYAEAGAFADGSSAGGNDGDYRVSDAPDAAATFTLAAPYTGRHHLALWFVAGANRHADARLFVEAAGLRFEYLLDLQTHGERWSPIADLDLNEADPVTVTLAAPSAPVVDRFLIADAVRIGAGRHSSDHPWWQMGAKPFAEYQSAPASVLTRGDVSVRPVYAEHFGADIYLSLHSNASGQPDSTAAGTATYRYNCGTFGDHSNDPPADQCDDPTGSDRLQALVHDHLVAALREDWDPDWLDRGTKVANFGELRELDRIPGVLVESAFHDNVRLPDGSNLRMTDNQALHDPRWRRAAARGMYRGVSEYFAPGGPLLAEPPEAIVLRRLDATSIEVAFEADPDAMAHRAYVAIDGRTFDAGRVLETNPAIIDGLPAGSIVAVRLAPLNAAGEGRASPVVAARPSERETQLLVVDAFQREDAWVQDIDNRRDTALDHALALAGVEHGFDTATEAALVTGAVDLADYDGIVVASGRESTEHALLTPALRAMIRTASVAVFLSGSEVAWTLDARGDEASRAFLADVFGVAYAADDAAVGSIRGAPGGGFAALTDVPLATEASGRLAAVSSDVLSLEGATAQLLYGPEDVAAASFGGNFVMGVALESLASAEHRSAILGAWARAIPLAPITPTQDGGIGDAGSVAPEAGTDPRDAGVDRDAGTDDKGLTRLYAGVDDPIRGGCGCTTVQYPDRERTAFIGFVLILFPLLRRRRGEA